MTVPKRGDGFFLCHERAIFGWYLYLLQVRMIDQ